MVVGATSRNEGGVLAPPLHHLEPEDVAVKGQRALDVGDLEVNVPDVDARVDRHGCILAGIASDPASHQRQ